MKTTKYKYVLLEPGTKLKRADEYFQYGQSPVGWRCVEDCCIGVVIPSMQTGCFPTVYRRRIPRSFNTKNQTEKGGGE